MGEPNLTISPTTLHHRRSRPLGLKLQAWVGTPGRCGVLAMPVAPSGKEDDVGSRLGVPKALGIDTKPPPP